MQPSNLSQRAFVGARRLSAFGRGPAATPADAIDALVAQAIWAAGPVGGARILVLTQSLRSPIARAAVRSAERLSPHGGGVDLMVLSLGLFGVDQLFAPVGVDLRLAAASGADGLQELAVIGGVAAWRGGPLGASTGSAIADGALIRRAADPAAYDLARMTLDTCWALTEA